MRRNAGAKGKVFLLDDDELIVSMLGRALRSEGYEVIESRDPGTAVERIRAFGPDVALLDVNLPGKSGIEVLQEVLAEGMTRQVVMLTADDSAETAVRAMKLGAADYLTKPFDLDEVKLVVRNVLEKGALRKEVDYLRKISAEFTDRPIVGISPAIEGLKETAARLAEAGVQTVLVTGESGTGKELFARFIHQVMHGSADSTYSPFIGVNCAALPEPLIESELFGHEKGAFTDARAERKGIFEAAYGGSVLLDEIGEMQPLLQSKLLRVLEERQIRRVGGRHDIPFEATVFATTNRDLKAAVEEGGFRSDLFFRLSAFALHVPALRERREDVPVLSRYYLERFARRYKRPQLTDISSGAEQLLASYGWPGNVRELRNVVERIVVLGRGTIVLPEHLPPEILAGAAQPVPAAIQAAPGAITLPPGGLSLDEVEKELIRQALARSGGNKTLAARLLGLSYDSLRYQVKKFGFE